MTHTPANAKGDDSQPDPKPKRWTRLILPGLLVLSLAMVAYLSVALARTTSEKRERDRVETAARVFVRELTSYSHETIERDIADVVALSTGSFKRDYQKAQGGQAFQAALVEAKGTSEGRLVAVAIRSISDDEAEVLTILDQTVTNNKQIEPRTERRFLELLMVKTGTGWKTDRVSVL